MPNFEQFEYKKGTRTPVRAKDIEAQQQWLDGQLYYIQKVENYNRLIKKLFVCKKCGKRITNPRWVHMNDSHSPDDFPITHYYHSKRQCNPHFVRVCLNCGKDFRINRKNQKLCSKKCSVKYMTSPILIKRCSRCGKEFKTRMIENKQNNEKHCHGCR
ncbi:MAG: hypothetical protein JSW11_11510 [Candidatus Heimdallarchaeota archaeon]|nr:MAG: hypothetical protein JSW11_11510 [Candidatus Heimdallarchaeota archaeon]